MYGAIVEDIEKQQRRRMQAEKEAKIEAKKKAKEGKLSADEVYYVDKHR